VTRYREVASDLGRRIVEGEFPIGATLPAEERLAREYEVARGTLRNALAVLERQGMLQPRQGSGWTVQSTLRTQGVAELRSFAEWAESRGFVPSGHVVRSERGTATALEARRLRVPPGDAVLRVTRVRGLDGRPVMLERTVYPGWVAPVVEPLPPEEPSVVRALAEAGIAMAFGSHTLDAIAASSEDARLLGVRRSSPLLRVRRVTAVRDGRVLESGDDRYLPGEVSFQVDASASSNRIGRTRG